MKKLLPITLAAAVIVLLVWAVVRRSAPPDVPFAKVHRETLVSTVETNGTAEPIEWMAIRTEQQGEIRKIHVDQGQRIRKGTVIAELDSGNARADLAAAEARIAEAKADLALLKRGGRPTEMAAIESDLAAARMEKETAEADLAALERLASKQAATGREVTLAKERVRKAELRITALEKRRAALVSPADRQQAEAKLKAAEADAAAARLRIRQFLIRAPMSGLLYRLVIRPGVYLRPGDPVGEIGNTDRLRILIYVDEPELGRVSAGMPVTITWDALPRKKWTGHVEKTPTVITARGTRKVGVVTGIIDNHNGELPPGANINAAIRSRVAENALTVAKESLRRRGSEIGVYLLSGDVVRWRQVEVGTSNITRAEITKGLNDGDAVALSSEVTLRDGMAVSPIFQPSPTAPR